MDSDRLVSLDGRWEFQHDPAGDLTPAGLGPMRPVNVPAPWQAGVEALRLRSGVGWYRRTFDVPSGWRGGSVLLRFGAVDYYAEVWVNGQRVGDHEGGYLPFAFEIHDRVGFDRPNELIVRVVDPGADTAETFPAFHFSEIPHGKQSWYGPIGGIWQSVTLEWRGASYVRELLLTPDAVSGRVTVSCDVAHPRVGRLTLRVHAPDGALVGETALPTTPDRETYETSLAVPNPSLWDVDHPALYRVQAELTTDGALVRDRASDTFGFRTIEARAGQILLNGRPIYLRGALDQAYYPGTIYTPPSEEFLRDRFRKAKELGLNCLRCHIKIEDPQYYRLADEMGLLVWTELPSWGDRQRRDHPQRTERATQRAQQTLEGMIRRDWNHPSIVCWTIVNEDWGTRVVTEESDRRWLRETYDFVKALDPHRLVVDNSACRPNFHVKSDLEDYHFYYAIPDHSEQWSSTVTDFAHRPAWSYSPNGDAVRTGQEPLVVSEFGNWGLPNVHDLIERHGGEPWWFDTGAEWGTGRTRGLVHPKGVLGRFSALKLDEVFGSYEAFVAASQEQQYEALKFEIEEMRRHESIQGYVITEMTDVHWECNGLLDLCNNPKSYHHRFAGINADDVIVPELSSRHRRAFWSGESLALDHAISHFSQRDLAGAICRWWMEPGDARGATGPLSTEFLPIGQVRRIRGVQVRLPEVEAPRAMRVRFELLDRAGSKAAENYLELYVFPGSLRRAPVKRSLHVVGPADRATALSACLAAMGYRLVDDWRQADLVVGLNFDETLRAIVRDGGRALCIVEDALSVTARLGPLDVIDRAGTGYAGDWASSFSWLSTNRLTHRVPSGPRFDWAFATVIPDQVIVGLDAPELARDGLAGLFLGWIQHPAALALQVNLGRGKLILTTLRLANPKGDPLGADPTATVLFQDFVEHALSGRFTPTRLVE